MRLSPAIILNVFFYFNNEKRYKAGLFLGKVPALCAHTGLYIVCTPHPGVCIKTPFYTTNRIFIVIKEKKLKKNIL